MHALARFPVFVLPLLLPQMCDGQSQWLSARQFRQHVTFLASDELAGRAPGTKGSKKAAEYIANRFAEMGLQPLATGIVAETRTAGHGRSDHAIFLERQIPAVHFFTGANSDYHQVTDETDRLNFEGSAKIATIGWHALQFGMTHPDLSYQKPNPVFDVSLALNLIRRLGVIPAQNAQDGQYPILRTFTRSDITTIASRRSVSNRPRIGYTMAFPTNH